MTQLFLDCEFTGLVKTAELISLCLYKDDDCYFYAEFTDYDGSILKQWHQTNVIAKLYFNGLQELEDVNNQTWKIKNQKDSIAKKLNEWLQQFERIEIWGDVPVYDWVLFCDLFGGALYIPSNIFYMPMDLATLAKLKLGNADFNRFEMAAYGLTEPEINLQHNAFADAKAEMLCYKKIMN